MLQFLKIVLASIAGIFVFIMLSITILFFSDKSKEPQVLPNAMLELKLNAPILERNLKNPWEGFNVLPSANTVGIGLIELKKTIRKAKADPRIKGILLNLSGVDAGFATLESIRDVLKDFKESKKKIIAYSNYMSEKAYYLASVANKVYLNPGGDLEFNGLSSQRIFFKGALDKLGVKAEIFRVGEFKSAVEPYLRQNMSEASRKQTESYLNSIYDFYLKNVAESRNIAFDSLKKISQNMLVHSPKTALEYGLIDKLSYYDELEDDLKKMLKVSKEKEDRLKKMLKFWEGIEYQTPFLISLSKYQKVYVKEYKQTYAKDKIAVIVASGTIESGGGNDGVISAKDFIKTIRKIREQDKYKALVLRINSPGGSALASDLMWREIMLTKKKMPVIASMSDVAASGGYYMAMPCDIIVAQPNTITGSIGIFGLMFNTKDFFEDKMGITTDRVNTGKFSALGNPNRDMSEEERAILQKSVEQGYEEFTSKAAKGRKMKVSKLKTLAGGRVWSGLEAKENGLVDELGSLEQAIEFAALKAKLKEDEYQIAYFPKKRTVLSVLWESWQIEAHEKVIQQKLGNLASYLDLLNDIQNQDFLQASLPYHLSID